MFAAALIVFRETLEAALFVGIIAAATKQLPLRGRLVVDRRREAHRPAAGGAVDPQLGPAQLVRSRGDLRAEVDEGAAHLRQCEDCGRLA